MTRHTRWLRLESSPEPFGDGDTLFHGIAIDITEQKRMKEALRDGEEKFREIFKCANDAIRVHVINETGVPDYSWTSMRLHAAFLAIPARRCSE